MTLPGETEAGSAGMQPCRGIAWWAHRDDVAGRGSSPFALCPKPYRIGRPLCLENPRPEGAEYSLTESAPSPFHAEPEHKWPDRRKETKDVREFEAESVAYIVCARQGIMTTAPQYLADYLGHNDEIPPIDIHRVLVVASKIEEIARTLKKPKKDSGTDRKSVV